jgi:hypothetical protein
MEDQFRRDHDSGPHEIERERIEDLNRETTNVKLARLDEKVVTAKDEIHQIKLMLEKYVTKIEFWPIKALVFGMAGLILSGVGAAIIALVIGRHN